MFSQSPTSLRKMAIGFGLWWLFWFHVQFILMKHLGFSWALAISDAGISVTLQALASYATVTTLRFYQPGPRHRFYRLAWSLVLSLICVLLIRLFMQHFFATETHYLDLLQRFMPVRFVFIFLMTTTVVLMSWMWHYVNDQKEQEDRKTDIEKLARDAELSSLRQQLQPHFLFNSLNSISALVGSRPEEARKMIQQLSDFLRGTLRKDEQQLQSLAEELQHLQLYLDIEKVRFGHRLSTHIECDENCLNMQLPSLLLQPIVENAIKFGLYDTIGETLIKIKAGAEADELLIEVQNPFDSHTSYPRTGAGFGLNSVQRRLYLLYARNDLLQTRQEADTFYTLVKIPQYHDQKHTD